MNSFLSKIFQLDAICEVTLLSTQGEILQSYRKTPPSAPIDTTPPGWNELIAGLGRPRTADFLFARGRYFLQQTPIGYLIVGMRDDSSLNKVKIACGAVRQKLTDPAIRRQTLLKLLVDVDDTAKPRVIKELGVLADRDVARVVCQPAKLKNRRLHERRPASSRLSIVLLDDQENDLGKRTKGELRDISLGGLALSFHASQQHAAGALLGKKVRISENCRDSGPALSRTGIIRAVGSHNHISNCYLMHLQFTQQLTAAEMQHVGAAARMLP